MKKKILITGSNSFVGYELIKYLSNYNYNIIGTYRKNKKFFNKKKIKQIKLNLKDKFILDKKFKILIHCASVTPPNEKGQNYFKANILGLKRLLNQSLKLKCKKIILVSSSVVYGSLGKPVSEKSPCRGKSVYAKSKLKMEDIALKFSKKNNIDLVIIRLSQIVGKNSINNYFSEIKKILKNKKPLIYLQSNKDTFNNICHISDVCKNIKKMMNLDHNNIKNKIFNFVSKNPTTIKKLKTAILHFNKETIFKENKIPKFYKISSDKNFKYNLRFQKTHNIIKSELR